MKYRVWDDEEGSRQHAIEIEASRASDAAHEYATRQPYMQHDGTEAILFVEDESGTIEEYRAESEINLTIYIDRIDA